MGIDKLAQGLGLIEREFSAGGSLDDDGLCLDAVADVFQSGQSNPDTAFTPGWEDELHTEPQGRHLAVVGALD